MKGSEVRINHLILGFLAATFTSYLLLSSLHINNESTFMIIAFNFLFVILTFPLNGRLSRKLAMLLIGNFVGLFWNSIFSSFAAAASNHFGKSFETLHIILNPFINLIWIVSFWCISLTALSNSKTRSRADT